MLILLFLCSLICLAAGAAMIVFGVPVKEFSFGDTLITGGIVAVVGGLVLGGIGFAIVHLQRIMEALTTQSLRQLQGREPQTAGAPVSRAGLPLRARSEQRPSANSAPESEPSIAASLPADEISHSSPMLRNPDDAPAFSEDANAALSSHEISAPPLAEEPLETTEPKHPPEASDLEAPGNVPPEKDNRGSAADWRPPTPAGRQPQSTFFDAMWPAEKRAGKVPPRDEPPGPSPEAPRGAKPAEAAQPSESEAARTKPGERRAVAILKSGVVDGMAYTLYVDGSIEAELPDGKLRFASINELRSYLERQS
ncbi:MAG TPA: hypothetical protein VFL51_12320 [Pseudolabrys sp.]|nr:hypothetical protein [Pseudolabrys sp.]